MDAGSGIFHSMKSGLAKAFHIKTADDLRGSEEEIKLLVADNDELLDDEKRMIHEIIDLGDMTVREVMQPRVDIISVEDVETVRTAIERMHGTGYSRLPVYHEDHDRIVGIVHCKDLMMAVLDGREDDSVGKYAFKPLFVPSSKDVYPLLAEMQTKRQQMAIVVDEYGGTDGLITVEDIIEEVIGEIMDESDVESKQVSQVEDGVWVADGSLPVEEAMDLGWPVEESDDYETLAGWLLDSIDLVPKPGDSFGIEGYSFTVEKMRRSRISKLRVVHDGDGDELCDAD